MSEFKSWLSKQFKNNPAYEVTKGDSWMRRERLTTSKISTDAYAYLKRVRKADPGKGKRSAYGLAAAYVGYAKQNIADRKRQIKRAEQGIQQGRMVRGK